MGVAGARADCEGGLIGERFVGEATERVERLRESEEEVRFRESRSWKKGG